MTIAAVRNRIADTRLLIVAATTVVATISRRGRMDLMIAAAIANHQNHTGRIVAAIVSLLGLMVLMIVVVSLHARTDLMEAQVSALIRVRLVTVLLR